MWQMASLTFLSSVEIEYSYVSLMKETFCGHYLTPDTVVSKQRFRVKSKGSQKLIACQYTKLLTSLCKSPQFTSILKTKK